MRVFSPPNVGFAALQNAENPRWNIKPALLLLIHNVGFLVAGDGKPALDGGKHALGGGKPALKLRPPATPPM